MFEGKAIDGVVLAASFTAQVSVAALQEIVDDFKARLGAVGAIVQDGGDYQMTFAKGSLRATIALDSDGKVSGLLFHDEVSDVDTAALKRALSADAVSADWFAPSFLSALPVDHMNAVLSQLRATEGAFQRVEVRGGMYYAVYEKGESHANIVTDAAGKITYLRLLPFTAKTSSLDDALQKLRPKSGTVAYLILEGRTDVAALDADRPMAVGSAFKLAVLTALREQVEAGRHRWEEVVPLAARRKSLPSGVLQTWPDGTPLTLATYAAEMISISDNTAADSLIEVVGRSAVEQIAPRNAPFLTTREMFALKTKDSAQRDRYRRASAGERRSILASIDAQEAPGLASLDLEPADLDIEWYFTPRELCALMKRVEDLDLMTINPGVAASGWRRIAFKGGSDAGVLDLTSYVTNPKGQSYCVTAAWNDRTAPLDESTLEAVFGAVLEQLAHR